MGKAKIKKQIIYYKIESKNKGEIVVKILTEIRYGIFLGIGFCFYSLFMWLTKLDTEFLSTGRYLDIAIIILPLIFTFLAIWAKSKEIKLTLFRRIQCGLTVNFIAYIIYTPFLLLYHNFINPNWLKYVLDLKEKELLAQNIEADQIAKQLETVRLMSSDMNLITNGFIVGVIIFGFIFSLATLPFFRKK